MRSLSMLFSIFLMSGCPELLTFVLRRAQPCIGLLPKPSPSGMNGSDSFVKLIRESLDSSAMAQVRFPYLIGIRSLCRFFRERLGLDSQTIRGGSWGAAKFANKLPNCIRTNVPSPTPNQGKSKCLASRKLHIMPSGFIHHRLTSLISLDVGSTCLAFAGNMDTMAIDCENVFRSCEN